MLRGLWKLTWLEIKIFMREPMGAFGAIVIPVLVFLVVGRIVGGRLEPPTLAANSFIHVGLPVLASLLIAINAVISLVTIISIYREGGILTCSIVLVYDRAVDQHLEHPVDRFSYCQHRSHSAFCAAHRRFHHVPDGRFLGTLRARRNAAASAPRGGASAAANLCGGASPGNLERRRMVGARRRCSSIGSSFCGLHRSFCEGVSLGVTGVGNLVQSRAKWAASARPTQTKFSPDLTLTGEVL